LPATAVSAQLEPGAARRALAFAHFAAITAVGVGCVVLLGWLLGIASLTVVLPGLATMKPNTAVCFVVAGAALGLQIDAAGRYRRAGRACGAGVAVVGLVTLSQDLWGWNAGIDGLLLPAGLAARQGAHPGRMSGATALCFLLLGVALLFLDSELDFGWRPCEPLAAAGLSVGLLGLLGYLFGFQQLYAVWWFSSMAVHTALLFVLLGAAALYARPDKGWIAVVTNDYSGALMARRVFPAGAGLTGLLAWLRTLGEHAGWYGQDFGRAMVTVGFVGLFAVVIWFNARLLNRTDAAQRQREQDLRASRHHLEESLREVADLRAALDEHAIVATTDQKGLITYVNDKFCDISKYPREELLGQDHRLINSGDHPKEFIRELWTTIASGRVWKGESRNRAKDGSIYWVGTTIVPFLDEGGKPYQYVAIGADITAWKQAEEALLRRSEELARSNSALEQFAYLASHDLQEPLRGIAGCVDLLRKHYTGRLDERADQFIAHAVTNLERMRDLIQGLLEYSRLDRGGLFQPVDCQALLQTVCESLAVAIEESQAQVVFENLPQLLADPLQLRQLFQNLVANAIKFRAPRPPRIRIWAERLGAGNNVAGNVASNNASNSVAGGNNTASNDAGGNGTASSDAGGNGTASSDAGGNGTASSDAGGNGTAGNNAGGNQASNNDSGNNNSGNNAGGSDASHNPSGGGWRFAVEDNGIGIEPQHFERVFQIFKRLKSRRDYPGTGIGLAVCKKIVERHGGRVWIESAPGQGSTFFFTIAASREGVVCNEAG
jgi:PAS domain S-box-containing protein